MSMQKIITDFYLKLNNYPTLKFISQDTGVQITRTFRILNGAPMKVSEYEIFEKKIKEKMNDLDLGRLMLEEKWAYLSPDDLKEINQLLQKKIKIKKLRGEI